MGYCSDVIFQLEDGQVSAHRALLMCRSEVMRAMFSRDFVERRSPMVCYHITLYHYFMYITTIFLFL